MDKSVRAILVEAYESGYEIKVEQDELLISGQSENVAVIDRIREHSVEVFKHVAFTLSRFHTRYSPIKLEGL